MGHDWEHSAANERLRRLRAEEGLDVQFARDGQFVPLPLAAAAAAAADAAALCEEE